jgi:hypothetical protein
MILNLREENLKNHRQTDDFIGREKPKFSQTFSRSANGFKFPFQISRTSLGFLTFFNLAVLLREAELPMFTSDFSSGSVTFSSE